MFDKLTERMGGVFDRLTGRGALKEADVLEALREIRVALLEADVALPVAKDFIERIKEDAIGEKVLRSVTPGQQVVKIVYDGLVAHLHDEDAALNLNVTAPAVILMAGLQGSGKTTTTGKLGIHLKNRLKKKALLASLDTYRPAAQEQLAILGRQTEVDTLPIVEGEKPVEIAKRALTAAKTGGYDVLILDTAGRLSIDQAMMDEVKAIRDIANPVETLLVLDALTGQDAVNTAQNFNDALGVTGVVLTRIDSDARGGAALSMRALTGKPIKFLGVGEQTDALQPFDARRIADRILDRGDIVSLVEKAIDATEADEAARIAAKMQKGKFDLDDLLSQLRQMKRMGGMGSMMSFLPGMNKIKQHIDDFSAGDKIVSRQEAIILSMTKSERANPDLLNASRRKRIAAGSGTSVQEVNQLMKQHMQMVTVMKKVSKGGMKGMMQAMSGMMGGNAPSMAEIQAMQKNGIPGFGDMPDLGGLGANPFDSKASPFGNNPLGKGSPSLGDLLNPKKKNGDSA